MKGSAAVLSFISATLSAEPANLSSLVVTEEKPTTMEDASLLSSLLFRSMFDVRCSTFKEWRTPIRPANGKVMGDENRFSLSLHGHGDSEVPATMEDASLGSSLLFHSMFDVRCSAFDVQRSMFDVRCSMFDVGVESAQ